MILAQIYAPAAELHYCDHGARISTFAGGGYSCNFRLIFMSASELYHSEFCFFFFDTDGPVLS